MAEAGPGADVIEAYLASRRGDRLSVEEPELVKACREGREDDVRKLAWREGAAELLEEEWGPDKLTPVMWAAREGHLGVLKVLVEALESSKLIGFNEVGTGTTIEWDDDDERGLRALPGDRSDSACSIG